RSCGQSAGRAQPDDASRPASWQDHSSLFWTCFAPALVGSYGLCFPCTGWNRRDRPGARICQVPSWEDRPRPSGDRCVLLPDIWVFWGEFVLARPKEKAELTTKNTKAHAGGPLDSNSEVRAQGFACWSHT